MNIKICPDKISFLITCKFVEETDFENGHFSNFQNSMTLVSSRFAETRFAEIRV